MERAAPVTISVFWPVEQLGQLEYLMRVCCSRGPTCAPSATIWDRPWAAAVP